MLAATISQSYWNQLALHLPSLQRRGTSFPISHSLYSLFYSWGVCDVEDASSGALHLASEGKVDGEKLCIDGGSAGGYTTLACLAFTQTFKAGVSSYSALV